MFHVKTEGFFLMGAGASTTDGAFAESAPSGPHPSNVASSSNPGTTPAVNNGNSGAAYPASSGK